MARRYGALMVETVRNGFDVTAGFNKLNRRLFDEVEEALYEAGVDLRDEWRRNAIQTVKMSNVPGSRGHGKWYPFSIKWKWELASDLTMAVGPDMTRKQGGMSFEYGSKNQPPHYDGALALDKILPPLRRRLYRIKLQGLMR